MELYHYTTVRRLETILGTKEFKPSGDTAYDSTYGPGWYLTDLPPGTCRKLLVDALWQNSKLHQRAKFYMKVEVVGANPKWKRPGVWFVQVSERVSFRIIEQGEVKSCCEDIAKCNYGTDETAAS